MFKFFVKFCILLGAIWRHNPRYNPQHKCSKTRGGVKGRLNNVKKTDDLVRENVPKDALIKNLEVACSR